MLVVGLVVGSIGASCVEDNLPGVDHCHFGLGVTMNGRDMPQLENVIGNFQNVACVRTDLAGCTTFLAVLERVKRSFVQTTNHA